MNIPAYIIHIDDAPRNVYGILKQVPYAQVLSVERHKIRSVGCLRSHQLAIQLAKDAGAPAVWVLEDDCVFTPAFSLEGWLGLAGNLPARGCDVLNGGVLRLAGPGALVWQDAKPLIYDLCAVGGQYWSSHCVVYRDTTYDALLAPMAPTVPYGPVGIPIDLRPGHLGFRTLVPLPFMAIQEEGYAELFVAHEAALLAGDKTRYRAMINAVISTDQAAENNYIAMTRR